MTWTIRAAFGLVVAGAAIALLQLWVGLLDPEVFVKTMITFGILMALVVAWNLVLRERRDLAKLRDKSKLD